MKTLSKADIKQRKMLTFKKALTMNLEMAPEFHVFSGDIYLVAFFFSWFVYVTAHRRKQNRANFEVKHGQFFHL